jgi:NhaP-type Na+/H+ or K+/H+ antiporter
LGRLRLLIEAESLMNDGTAAVAFVAVLSVLAGGQETVLSITGTLLVTIVGGVLIGGVVALGFMLLAGRTANLTAASAFGSCDRPSRLAVISESSSFARLLARKLCADRQ